MDSSRFDAISRGLAARRLTRRAALGSGAAMFAGAALGTPGRVRAAQGTATPAPSGAADPAAAIVAIARDAIDQYDLKAVIPLSLVGSGRHSSSTSVSVMPHV